MARAKKQASKFNKMKAVREALASLGKKAKPGDIQEYVKNQYGEELSYNIVSNYKSVLSKPKKKGRKARGRPKATAASTVAPKANGASKEISLRDIEEVKKLTDKIGADKVMKIASVLK